MNHGDNLEYVAELYSKNFNVFTLEYRGYITLFREFNTLSDVRCPVMVSLRDPLQKKVNHTTMFNASTRSNVID